MHDDDRLAKAELPGKDALRLHPFYRGKIQTALKCPVNELADFAIWYTPGVAAPCRAIQASPEAVYEHTNKGNTVAVVSNGTRVLGLGDIGPEAGLPVMEGKALLFKYLGGIDAIPLCVRSNDPDELVALVQALEPSFGGINLEDIAQPGCFRVLDALRDRLEIPVWHDDQQGTATVLYAALLNALEIVGKKLDEVKIALIGMGAANIATYRLLVSSGVDPQAVLGCDSRGVLGQHREDIERERMRFPDKWRVCQETNADATRGGIAEALRGADVCVAFSAPGPDTIQPDWVKKMASDAIVFACANPIPELWPWVAKEAGARIVATGRGDFPNQVNNSLGFPGIFRGVLDVRARAIHDDMARAAAGALASHARRKKLDEEHLLPTMSDWEVFVEEAVATGLTAQDLGLAQIVRTRQELETEARAKIEAAREQTHALMREGLIPPAPRSAQ